MYIPQAFREERREVLREFVRGHGFGTVVSQTPEGPFASHLPVLVESDDDVGVLRTHMARANPHWRWLDGSHGEALVIFQGPHAYVSPSWYVSRAVVPTWNYVVVHAYGLPRVLEEVADVRNVLAETVRQYEGSRQSPWRMSDLPADVLEKLAGEVVAVEIAVTRLEGKWKLGQNRMAADREAAGRVLAESGNQSEAAIGGMMLGWLREPA